ncbi:MAG: signal peptidase I [Candidatus Makaraimicrobium thalassicum]|nr:MAG: signal peptidase I [Candidatus Omnitrophota bacterium]
MKFNRSSWDYLWAEWIKPILIAAVLAFFIRTFVTQPFKIPSSSMYPTLRPGDRIFVNKFIHGVRLPLTGIRLPAIRPPMLGDIVVFISPVEKKKYLVKRFIAGGGESVQIKGGELFVDGKRIDGNPFKRFFYYNRGKYGAEDEVIHVPEGCFYALGDNSANSLDSRYWGFVPDKNLVGNAFLIHWPIKRIQLIRKGD